MSPANDEPVPPEVLAIAVALAVQLRAAEAVRPAPAEPPSRWRWAGRRWERATAHRWS
ncbi:MAG: hypothetical protein ACR2HM_10770 [Acidimicrobiales bacterium]